jgi:hypothetical protein
MDYQGKRFVGTVELDGNSYKDCSFRRVKFVYGGGSLHMENCQLDEFSWELTGDLANGLHALHQLFGLEGMLTILRGFVEPTTGVVELQPKND